MTKKLLLLPLILCLSFMGEISKNYAKTPVKAEENATSSVLYENYFDSTNDNIGSDIVFDNNVGKVTTTNWIQFPTELAPSNNYEINFKIKASNNFYFHLHGLDASHDGWSMYLCGEGGGQYWSFRRQYEGDGFYCIYNNSGQDQGGLNYDAADFKNTYANVKIIHLDGYLELWVNNVRRIVTHLSNFGNCTNPGSKGRRTIEEGTIDYIALAATAANTTFVDDIVVKEITTTSFYDVESGYNETHYAARDILPVSAEILNHDNFIIESTWNVFDPTYTAQRYYPRISLFGLNASLTTICNYSYGISVQSDHDGAYANPSIWYNLEGQGMTGVQKGKETPPAGATPGEYAVLVNDTFTFRIEVFGDNFKLYCNNVLSIDQTFTALGLTKGHLQYIMMESGNGKSYWTKCSYRGFDNYPDVIAESDKDIIAVGETVIIKAALMGLDPNTFYWYKDNQKTSLQSLTLTLSDLEKGTYQYYYSNDEYSSEVITIIVVSNQIIVESDKTSANPLEAITFTATLIGSFVGEEFAWYVNDTKTDHTGTTFIMEHYATGTYHVKYVSTTTESNTIMVSINPGTIEIASNKGCYFISEQALVTSTCVGIQDPETLHWYVNNEEITGYTGKELLIEMSQYGYGTILTVYAVSNELTNSNTITIIAAYDVYKNISERQEWENAYSFIPLPDNMYGDFLAHEDTTTYLQSAGSSSPVYTFPEDMTANIGTLNYSFEYEIFVPNTVNSTYYVYPTFNGINGAYPTSDVEIALEVNASGIYPYIKNSSDRTYSPDKFGFNVDTSFNGICVKNEWNSVKVAFSNNSVAYYLNDTQVLFTAWNNMAMPNNITMRMYATGGDAVPVRIRNMLTNAVGATQGVLESVLLSVSRIVCDVNETIYLNAYCNPYNAKYSTISFYINGEFIENNNEAELMFKSDVEGEFECYVVVDDIQSKTKTITVKKGTKKDDTTKVDNSDAWFFIMLLCIAIAGIITAIVFKVYKRRKYK